VATPRSPYVCIADSLLNEPWPAEVKLAMVQLSCHIHQRWRSDRRLTLESACENHPMSLGDLITVTTRTSRARCVGVMRALRACTGLRIVSESPTFIISWPKWAEYNRKHSRSMPGHRAGDEPANCPSETETETASEEEKSRAVKPPTDRARKRAPNGRGGEAPNTWDTRCAALLRDLLVDVPGARIQAGSVARWSKDIARIPREVPSISGDPEKHVEAAIRWALGPQNLGREYEVLVRSGRALRQKWPQLVAAAQRRAREDDASQPIDPASLAASFEASHGTR
jgi:hypothetical protein